MRASSREPGPARAERARMVGRGVGVAGGVLAALAGLGTLADWRSQHLVLINASQSLPDWAFVVARGQFPERGQYIAFAPGSHPLVRRHFGQSPPAFVKIAYGVPGDRVSRSGAWVQVNDRPVAQLKPRTQQGELLKPGPLGVVPQHCVFAGSAHKDGLDSRYAAIGFVCADRLIGTAEAIL